MITRHWGRHIPACIPCTCQILYFRCVLIGPRFRGQAPLILAEIFVDSQRKLVCSMCGISVLECCIETDGLYRWATFLVFKCQAKVHCPRNHYWNTLHQFLQYYSYFLKLKQVCLQDSLINLIWNGQIYKIKRRSFPRWTFWTMELATILLTEQMYLCFNTTLMSASSISVWQAPMTSTKAPQWIKTQIIPPALK